MTYPTYSYVSIFDRVDGNDGNDTFSLKMVIRIPMGGSDPEFAEFVAAALNTAHYPCNNGHSHRFIVRETPMVVLEDEDIYNANRSYLDWMYRAYPEWCADSQCKVCNGGGVVMEKHDDGPTESLVCMCCHPLNMTPDGKQRIRTMSSWVICLSQGYTETENLYLVEANPVTDNGFSMGKTVLRTTHDKTKALRFKTFYDARDEMNQICGWAGMQRVEEIAIPRNA
jgi:hypothetical protein